MPSGRQVRGPLRRRLYLPRTFKANLPEQLPEKVSGSTVLGMSSTGGGGAPSRLRGWGGVEGVWGELFQPSAVSAGALLLGSKPPVPKLVQWASRVGRPSSETGPTSRDKVLGAALHSVLCSRVFFWGRFAEAHGDVHDPLEARSWASGDLGGRLQPGPRPAVASAGSCCSAVRPSLSRRLPACSAAATAAVPWWGV